MKIKYRRKKARKLFLSTSFLTTLLIIVLLEFSASYALFTEQLKIVGTIKGENPSAPTTYTYYFERPSTWVTATPYAYLWYSVDESKNAAYPGVQMKSEGNNIFSITVDADKNFDYIIFSNGRYEQETKWVDNLKLDLAFVKTGNLSLSGNNGKIYKIALSSTKTIYFEDWYSWGNIYAYTWTGSNQNHAWPGIKATSAGTIKEAGGSNAHNLYSYEIGTARLSAIFNNNGSKQTQNLNASDADGAAWCVRNGGKKWHWEILNGGWYDRS